MLGKVITAHKTSLKTQKKKDGYKERETRSILSILDLKEGKL